MQEDTRRAVKEGLAYGSVAGVLFGTMEIAGAALMGDPPVMPLRMFASVVLGSEALETRAVGRFMSVGIVAHLVLSAMFGLVYGLVYGLANAGLSLDTQTRWGRQVSMGLLFGVLLWFVNFQIIARMVYPRFLQTPQFLQMAMHAAFFGFPLALMYARAERQVHHIGVHATA